jgi:hypothetical protein
LDQDQRSSVGGIREAVYATVLAMVSYRSPDGLLGKARPFREGERRHSTRQPVVVLGGACRVDMGKVDLFQVSSNLR